MHFSTMSAIFTAVVLFNGALAAPAPNAEAGPEVTVELTKRGHGCGVWSSDDGICNFYVCRQSRHSWLLH
jgi:hypothetical protein